MLFNSYEFLFAFLPLTLGGFFALSALSWHRAAASLLALASLFFYGYWAPQYLLLLLGSITINFMTGKAITRSALSGQEKQASRLLIAAVTLNLLVLAYYKYANFFLDTARTLTTWNAPVLDVVLPIGISFFTFTQIAFLVDCRQGKVKEQDAINYVLFVSYFPHLIAGPVLHHAEMMPQFGRSETYRFVPENFVIGMAFFVVGLFKKIVLADGIQPYVAPVFDGGGDPHFFAAWGGALAYTLQLYFDFSAYSDMAVGLSKMFNVDLPFNFNSPYKARNISDFWRRWHMTLSRFLREYLYIQMGGNRQGPFRRYVNLLVTMLLGGLWHGAGWTFVIWGGLHGIYLVINHGWVALREKGVLRLPSMGILGSLAACLLTFLSVVIAWVFFRATSLGAATRVLSGMFGMNDILFPVDLAHWFGLQPNADLEIDWRQICWIVALLSFAWLLPNSQQIVRRWVDGGGLASKLQVRWVFTGASLSLLLLLAVINDSRGVSEFIYFNF